MKCTLKSLPRYSQNLPRVWHSCPVNRDGQIQTKDDWPVKHVPPFVQGLEKQKSETFQQETKNVQTKAQELRLSQFYRLQREKSRPQVQCLSPGGSCCSSNTVCQHCGRKLKAKANNKNNFFTSGWSNCIWWGWGFTVCSDETGRARTEKWTPRTGVT